MFGKMQTHLIHMSLKTNDFHLSIFYINSITWKYLTMYVNVVVGFFSEGGGGVDTVPTPPARLLAKYWVFFTSWECVLTVNTSMWCMKEQYHLDVDFSFLPTIFWLMSISPQGQSSLRTHLAFLHRWRFNYMHIFCSWTIFKRCVWATVPCYYYISVCKQETTETWTSVHLVR